MRSHTVLPAATRAEYCLANGITIVEGRHRSAMYDLSHNRLMLISRELTQCFDNGRLNPGQHNISERDIGSLLDMGYIQRLPYNDWRPFNMDNPFLRGPLPLTLTLIVHLSVESVDYLGAILYELSVERRTRHVIFLCQDVDQVIVHSAIALAQRAKLTYELGSLQSKHLKTVIYSPEGTIIGNRKISKSNLIDVSYTTYTRLHSENESCGQLYISASVQFSSHWDEHFYFYEVLDPLRPETYVEDDTYKLVSRNTKDHRDVCAQCELRYACRYSYTDRLRADRITSGPANCSYSKNVI